MTNKQALAEALQELKERREQNDALEQQRRAEACEKCPGLEGLLSERHSLIMKAAMGLFSAGNADPEAVMREYNARIREKLSENGFSQDYLQPIYTCEKCRDTGYTGDVVRVPCACLLEKCKARMISVQQGGQTFENFDLNVFPDDETLPGYGLTQRE